MKQIQLTMLLAALLSVSARAEVTVEASVEPPDSSGVVVAHEVSDGAAVGYQWRNNPEHGRRDLGQVFTPEMDFVLTGITVQLQSGSGVGTKDAPFRLVVFETEPGSEKMTRELAAGSGYLPPEVSEANTYMTFKLEEGVPLTAGKTFGFLLIFDEESDVQAVSLQSENRGGDQETNGRIESRNGESITVSGANLEFHLLEARP